MFSDQSEFDVRFEWGLDGIDQLLDSSDVVIIVDVLSFSTSVDIAVSNGAQVFPFGDDPNKIKLFASERNAVLLETKRSRFQYSLSPASLSTIPTGMRIVLPSLNGSKLSTRTGKSPTFTACLRNAAVVAQAAQKTGKKISVIPAGEKWKNGNFRPAFEDLIGAGAVISHLSGKKSPEALASQFSFIPFSKNLLNNLKQCSSGKELVEKGFEEDVLLAASLDCSTTIPFLNDGAYQAFAE